MSIQRCNPSYEYETGLTMVDHPEGEYVYYDDQAAEVRRLVSERDEAYRARDQLLIKLGKTEGTLELLARRILEVVGSAALEE